MTMANVGPPNRPVGYPPHSPRPPRPAETGRVSHGLHLAITILLVIVTFFTLGWFWLLVWFIHALVVDAGNHRERRRYDREFAEFDRAYREWQDKVLEWQFHWRRAFGYEPTLPPNW